MNEDSEDEERDELIETMRDGDVLEMRDAVLLDHLINLTDQVRRLADALRAAGLAVPDDVGTLGPASEETVMRLTSESVSRDFHHVGRPMPREEAREEASEP